MKYYEKNMICFKHGILHVEKEGFWGEQDLLFQIMDSSFPNEKKLGMYFQAVDKSKFAPTKEMFEKAIQKAKQGYNTGKFIPLIQKNLEKWYPKEEN